MKDFIKINRAIDEKSYENLVRNIQILKGTGAYPDYFEYPVTLQFELTGRCNLACKHCYNRSGDSDRGNDSYTLLTPEKWVEIAKQVVRDGGIFQCILSGGEPLLLGDKLFDIMDVLHDDGTSFVLITNGYLLTPELVKRFIKYRWYWFQVSIDGLTAEVHDSFRGVKGSWERAVRGAVEVSSAGIPLVIAHSVTPDSLKQLDAMAEFVYNMGASSLILGEILPSGRAISNTDIIMNHDEKNELYGKIAELQAKYQGRMTVKRSAELRTQLKRYSVEQNMGGIIRPNGDFRLDCMAPFVIGNVLDNSIKDIWLSKGINAWQSKEVQDFIASVNDETQSGNIENHVAQDIIL